MQISTRSLSVLVLVLLAAACGSAGDPNSMPAANGGAVVQGTVMGGGSQNMRVAVPSSSAATNTNTAGGFVLTGVPKGATALQFSGGGQSATLATAAVVPGEFRRLTVSISGSSATEHSEQTETEFEGTVDAIDGMVIAPGDLVLGDDDGVLCVPFDQIEDVFKAATAKYDAEQRQIANIQAGKHDASWVDKQLREMKCEGVD